MDYRNYDQGRPVLPAFILRHTRHLKPLGLVFCSLGLLFPFLMVVRLLHSTYFLNFMSYLFLLVGPILYLLGYALDGYLDRPK